ncbi:MAG: M4 family metallopeptidase [Bdellovibrionota bacterium]
MGLKEPARRKLWKAVCSLTIFASVFLTLGLSSEPASAKRSNPQQLQYRTQSLSEVFRSVTGWRKVSSRHDFEALLEKAHRKIHQENDVRFEGFYRDESTQFEPTQTSNDGSSATIRFAQKYKGIDVVGHDAIVHFDHEGNVQDVSGAALNAAVDVNPRVSAQDALRIVSDHYQEPVELSENPALKVFKDFDGRTHLTYHLLTRTTSEHAGKEVYLNAHNGSIVLEFDRTYDMHAGSSHVEFRTSPEFTTPKPHERGNILVYTADTEQARKHVDRRGYATSVNINWYDKVIENGSKLAPVDVSAINAYRNSSRVYNYFFKKFGRRSFDDEDGKVVSVVHVGIKMNNAFWTNEFKIMGYGDGDGEHFIDLTYSLDAAGHEMTHGITANTAKLVYAGEPGALNESYSDFFGRMIDYTDGNWDIGANIMAPKSKSRALRNMLNPEEYKQPGSTDSKFKVSTKGPCHRANDRCGVHVNSGIPNRAAALIVQSIGKEDTEQLYYNVLTKRLSAMSGFREAREETEKECEVLFGKDKPSHCEAVKKAFDTVKM